MSSVLQIPAATPQQSFDYLQAKSLITPTPGIGRKIWPVRHQKLW